jgi:uncharacterized protein (DUF1015 family)
VLFGGIILPLSATSFNVSILKPIHIETLKEVADKGKIMPPKSTYIEPKLRSGLTIYPIE